MMPENPSIRLLALVLLLAASVGCVEMEMPTSEEVKDVFSEHSESHLLEVPEPVGVPELDSSELGGWRVLCDQCHQGPHYSSGTFLVWAHNDECRAQVSCLECHKQHLHRLDVRGSKGKCIECHMESGSSLDCSFCHIEGWKELHTPDGHSIRTHGTQAIDGSMPCDSCHGSSNWCIDCHGLQMPHPETILIDHPTLVRGKPDTCSLCHGNKACENCHTERGVF